MNNKRKKKSHFNNTLKPKYDSANCLMGWKKSKNVIIPQGKSRKFLISENKLEHFETSEKIFRKKKKNHFIKQHEIFFKTFLFINTVFAFHAIFFLSTYFQSFLVIQRISVSASLKFL